MALVNSGLAKGSPGGHGARAALRRPKINI